MAKQKPPLLSLSHSLSLSPPRSNTFLLLRSNICLLLLERVPSSGFPPETQTAESSPSLSFLCYLIAWMPFPVFIFLVCLAGLEGLTCWKTAITSLAATLAKGQQKKRVLVTPSFLSDYQQRPKATDAEGEQVPVCPYLEVDISRCSSLGRTGHISQRWDLSGMGRTQPPGKH